jgi:sugar O-acyltransferase (sialic acid O-acetyltransferase NeuD family)
MKNLIIIGASGFGRDIYNLALGCTGYLKDYTIKGFLDRRKDFLNSFTGYPPILSSVEDYIVVKDDVFICAMGEVQSKKFCINLILKKGGEFISLISPSAHIDPYAKIGTGCIVLQNAVLGAGSQIGDFVLVQICTIVGHDVKVGNYSRIDCHAVCVGGVIVEDEATIHTSAVINHKVLIGKGASVGAGSFVIRNVKENTTVYGNPALKLK